MPRVEPGSSGLAAMRKSGHGTEEELEQARGWTFLGGPESDDPEE